VRSRLSDVVTRMVVVVPPDLPVSEVAARMRDQNLGCFPVCDAGAVVGMITDRDLALRVFAENRDPSATPVGAVMSREIISCEPGDRLEEVLELMARWKVRRIPVISNDGQLVGMATLGKSAGAEWSGAGEVLGRILQPSSRKRR